MKRDTVLMFTTMAAAMAMMVFLVWWQARHEQSHSGDSCTQGERK